MAKDRLTTWENALVLVDDADGGVPFFAHGSEDAGQFTISVPSSEAQFEATVRVIHLTPRGREAHWAVLWESPGLLSLHYARRYAAAILAAVRLAERLNATERREEVTA